MPAEPIGAAERGPPFDNGALGVKRGSA